MASARRAVLLLAWALALVGLVLRAWDLGTYGLWTDEAWVALCTRVQGLAAFWLAIAPTPLLWAVTLKLWSFAGSSEAWLRGLPLLASALGLWVAFRIGRDLTGHPAGGLLPLGVLAVDLHSIVHAKVLKQYSTEALLALAAFDAAARFARDGERRTLAWLGIVLALGVGFANSQLLVAPPLLGALLVVAVARGDWPRAGRVAMVGITVGLWDLGCFQLLIAPRLLPSLGTYFAGEYAPAGDLGRALGVVWGVLEGNLVTTLGTLGLVRGLTALALVVFAAGAGRAVVIALVGLVLEVTLLSSWQRVPIAAPRVLLFLLVVLNVSAASAVGPAVAWTWRRAMLRPAVVLLLGAAAVTFVRGHDWRELAPAHQIEDLGPLVRQVEAERRPGEPLLLYARSTYTYAYYQSRTPKLMPNPAATVGYSPVFDDPDIVLVDGANIARAAEAAFAKGTRVWFLGSRLLGADPSRIRSALQRPGWHVEEVVRVNAAMLRVSRVPPT